MSERHPVITGIRLARRSARRATAAGQRVPHPRVKKSDELGANYDTTWARKWRARTVRFAFIELVTKPFVVWASKPDVRHIERLDGVPGPIILAGNHASHLDTSLMLSSLPRRFRHRAVVAAAADYFFDKQWKGFVWALFLNIIPIEREKVGRKSTELATQLLNENWNLVIFPEGSRSRDGSIGKFRGGAAYMSMKCDVPVLPVFIGGTFDIMGPNVRGVKRGHAVIEFGDPLYPGPDEKSRGFNERIEGAVREMAEKHAAEQANEPAPRWPNV